MNVLSASLICVSMFTHAYFNFLIKKSQNKHIVIALSKVLLVVLLAVPTCLLFKIDSVTNAMLLLIVFGGVLTFVHYVLLSNAYTHGELSIAYPISRCSAAFVPIISYYLLDETIDGIGIFAIILILLGILVMHLDTFDKNGLSRALTNVNAPVTWYSMMGAICIAMYLTLHKMSVTLISPFIYYYFYSAIAGVCYSLFCLKNFGTKHITVEWGRSRWRIIQLSLLDAVTYIFVLIALQTSKLAYVGGLRQLSVVIGVYLAYAFLGEKITTPKILGMLISVCGAVLIYLAT
jgi:uncharacterized membrane protein